MSMWTSTVEEMVGIHSATWLPCNDRVPLVQWPRKADAWSQRGTRPLPRRMRSRLWADVAAGRWGTVPDGLISQGNFGWV